MKRALLLLLGLTLLVFPVLGQHAPQNGKRSAAVRRAFVRQNPPPEKCRPEGLGRCEVDHIVPLHCGGKDKVGNMQWLTVAEHKAKTRRERRCEGIGR